MGKYQPKRSESNAGAAPGGEHARGLEQMRMQKIIAGCGLDGDNLILAIVRSCIKAACDQKTGPLLHHQRAVDLPIPAFRLLSFPNLPPFPLRFIFQGRAGRSSLFFCSGVTFVFLVIHFLRLALQVTSAFIGSQIKEGENSWSNGRLVCNSRRPLGSPRKTTGFKRVKDDGYGDVTSVSHPRWPGVLRDG